jgi:hypothetical protein
MLSQRRFNLSKRRFMLRQRRFNLSRLNKSGGIASEWRCIDATFIAKLFIFYANAGNRKEW